MSPRYVIDTNLLVYLHDVNTPAKRARASAVIEHLAVAQNSAIPAQVLAEFASVALRKMKPPLDPEGVREQIERFIDVFTVLPLSPAVVLEAIRGVRDHKLAYYDAQIWAAARIGQIPAVLSEDFNSGGAVEGVVFINPFAPEFVVADLR